MDDPKGKGKARDTSGEDKNSSQTSSLFSRVASSAKGLTSSMLKSPNNNELHAAAEAALSNSGKGQSLSNGGGDHSAWAESSRSAQIPAQRSASHGVREGHNQEHIKYSEQEFSTFLDGTDPFISTESLGIGIPLEGIDPATGFNLFSPLEGPYRPIYTKDGIDIMGSLAELNSEILAYTGPGELKFTRSGYNVSALRAELLEGIEERDLHPTANTLPEQQPRGINPTRPSNLSVTEQEAQDGADVLAILSGPTHEDFEALEYTQEPSDWGLTPKQASYLREITKDILTPLPKHSGVSPHNPLNLSPEFDDASWEARQHQREQWDDVLTNYADDVWGDLLPLVKQARTEVKEMDQDGSVAELSSALRRLQSILGHLQKN